VKKVLGIIITSAALVIGCVAMAAPMDATFGNTVNVAAPDGTIVLSYRYYDNGTVGVTSSEGSVTGTWVLTGTDLCLTVMEQESCFDVSEERGVGDSWTTTDEDGVEYTITIDEGH